MADQERRHLYMDIAEAYIRYETVINQVVLGARKDLSKTQLMVLILSGSGAAPNLGALSDALAVSREHISRATSALERDGYIAKRRDPKNGRKVGFVLTEKAEEYLEGHRDRMDAAFSEVFAGVNDETLTRLAAASREASARLDEAHPRALPFPQRPPSARLD